jgi:hypothetical protein
MNVFISWSGERSKAVALLLRDWLPEVMQSIVPWMSDEDIAKGARWSPEIAGELEDARAGILCVTPENQVSPWLNFEGGSLAKTIANTYVCPYLIDLTPSQVTGPLSQFQCTVSTKQDTKKLVTTLNVALGSTLTDRLLERSFDKSWPDLEAGLAKIPQPMAAPTRSRSLESMVEESLEIMRVLRDRPVPAVVRSSRDLMPAAAGAGSAVGSLSAAATSKIHLLLARAADLGMTKDQDRVWRLAHAVSGDAIVESLAIFVDGLAARAQGNRPEQSVPDLT